MVEPIIRLAIMSHTHTSISIQKCTYSIQPPSPKNPLGRRRRIPSIPLQVPRNVSSAQLGEHLRYLVDLSGVYACGGSVMCRVRGGRLAEVPS